MYHVSATTIAVGTTYFFVIATSCNERKNIVDNQRNSNEEKSDATKHKTFDFEMMSTFRAVE